VSYLARVARRAAASGRPVTLTPAGRNTSPLARFDQRLNMLVPPPAVGVLSGGPDALGRGDDDIAFDGPAGEGAPPAPAATAAASATSDRPRARRRGEPPPGGAPPALRPHAPPSGSAAADAAAEVSSRSRASASSRSPADAGAGPADAAAPGASAARDEASSAASLPFAARDRIAGRLGGGREAGPAGPASSLDAGPAPSSPSATPPATDPLADALAKLSRWLAKPPRERGRGARDGNDGQEPSGGRDRRDGPPRGAAGAGPAVARPTHRPGARGAAPAPAGITAQPPRLRIGRIDVQVVMPPPPAPPPVVRRAGRTGASASSPATAPTLPSYLTFGLRQR
jgi:hypothetical protein